MYQITLSLGNAINGSINQQKITRGYLFARIKNNSNLPRYQDISDTALQQYGLFFMGWAYKREGSEVVAPCYPFKTFIKANNNEKCEDKYTKETTQEIRVQTVVGICPTTYVILDQNTIEKNVLTFSCSNI